jgi:hypothetical protein
MKIFNSIGHAFAWVLSHIVPVAKEAQAIIESPLGTALAGLIGSKGAQVQADIEAVAGSVLAAATATGAAVGASGLNIVFDEAAIAAIERLVGTVGGLFGKTPATKTA